MDVTLLVTKRAFSVEIRFAGSHTLSMKAADFWGAFMHRPSLSAVHSSSSSGGGGGPRQHQAIHGLQNGKKKGKAVADLPVWDCRCPIGSGIGGGDGGGDGEWEGV